MFKNKINKIVQQGEIQEFRETQKPVAILTQPIRIVGHVSTTYSETTVLLISKRKINGHTGKTILNRSSSGLYSYCALGYY